MKIYLTICNTKGLPFVLDVKSDDNNEVFVKQYTTNRYFYYLCIIET